MRASSRDNVHPLTPTTTPLHGRVAENPHIAFRHHGHESMTRERDEGRAVGTLFVGYAPMPSPTDSAWVLRGVVLGVYTPAPVLILPSIEVVVWRKTPTSRIVTMALCP